MKASLLQPLRDHATIATRLDTVEEVPLFLFPYGQLE